VIDNDLCRPALILSLAQGFTDRRPLILHNEAAGRTLEAWLSNAFFKIYSGIA
jgi:hypothetical protein